jgi:hypothetical protein
LCQQLISTFKLVPQVQAGAAAEPARNAWSAGSFSGLGMGMPDFVHALLRLVEKKTGAALRLVR